MVAETSRQGMTFVGSTIIYAYLQTIGIINAHSDDCWLHGSWEKHEPLQR